MENRSLRTTIGYGDADRDIVRTALGILSEDVEVAVLVEDTAISELEFQVGLAPPAVFLDQPVVGKLRLRVFVECFEIGVGGRGLEVEIRLFHVLSVVALWPGKTEEPFLQDGIAAVPQRQTKAEP